MWLCTTAAPAAKQRSASSAISAGSFGVFGLCFLLVTPLIAASMITGPAIASPTSHFPTCLQNWNSLQSAEARR